MAAVSTQRSLRLSFDHDLRHAYPTVATRLQKGAKSLDGVLAILQMRIEAEAQFTNQLQKIIGASTKLMTNISPNETLRRDGLDALYTDFKNEYTQRMAFLNSLKQDVQKPLVRMKDFYYTQNKAFAAQTKANLKALKNQQNEFAKLKQKYTKIVSGDKSKKKQQLLMVKKRFTQQQLIWKKQQQIYDNRMTVTLQNMEANEYKRMNSMRDGMINWAAFTTNYCANRSYDIRDLAQSMSLMNIESDLQSFMKRTLCECPSPLPMTTKKPQRIHTPMAKKNESKFQYNNVKYMKINAKQNGNDYFQNYFKHKFQKQPSSDQSITSSSKISELSDED